MPENTIAKNNIERNNIGNIIDSNIFTHLDSAFNKCAALTNSIYYNSKPYLGNISNVLLPLKEQFPF